MFRGKKDKKTQSLHEFYQDKKYDQDYSWIDYYRPNRKKNNYGWGNEQNRETGGSGKRTLYRVIAVLSILAVFLMIREFNTPVGTDIREGLRYVLTTDWNVRPVMEKAVKFGLQMAGVESPLDSGAPMDGMTKEVMGQSTLPTGILIPVSGKLGRPYGWSIDPMDNLERFHHGIDIIASPGTPVKAVLPGKADKISTSPLYGQYIQIHHGEGVSTLYAGIGNIKVKEGQSVKTGETIAEVGKSGDFKEGGLHFELRENGTLVDPLTKIEFPPVR